MLDCWGRKRPCRQNRPRCIPIARRNLRRPDAIEQHFLRHRDGGMFHPDPRRGGSPSDNALPDSGQTIEEARLVENIPDEREGLVAEQDYRQSWTIYWLKINSEAGLGQQVRTAISCYAIAPNDHVLRNNDDAGVRHVVVQIPGLLVLERGGIVDFNIKARSVNVKLLDVGGNAEGES